jgi:integrase
MAPRASKASAHPTTTSSAPPPAPVRRRPQPSRYWYLLEVGYAKRTIISYKAAVRLFLSWCSDHGYEAHSFDQLDALLTEYFHDLFDRRGGSGKQLARNTLYAIFAALPSSKPHLFVALRCVRRWSKLMPPKSFPPLTWELSVAIAVQMARVGHYRFAVATLLGFDCLLRSSELLSLTASDIADAGDVRMGSEYRQMCVAIRQAKTGSNQSVTVESDEVKDLLRPLLRTSSRHSPLFPGGPALYRALFKAACSSLGLSDRYVPHSLRHGGATRLYLRGVPVEDILLRGRWVSQKAARTYVQAGRALLMSMSVPVRTASAASLFALDVVSSLALAQLHK